MGVAKYAFSLRDGNSPLSPALSPLVEKGGFEIAISSEFAGACVTSSPSPVRVATLHRLF
jgi:hypothetical protein